MRGYMAAQLCACVARSPGQVKGWSKRKCSVLHVGAGLHVGGCKAVLQHMHTLG